MVYIPSAGADNSKQAIVDKLLPVYNVVFAGKQVSLLSSSQVIDNEAVIPFTPPSSGTTNDLIESDVKFYIKDNDQYATIDSTNLNLFDIPVDDDLVDTTVDSITHNISGSQYQISSNLVGGVTIDGVQLRAWTESAGSLGIGTPIIVKPDTAVWKLLDDAVVYVDNNGLGILKIDISGTTITAGTDELLEPFYGGDFDVVKTTDGYIVATSTTVYYISNDLTVINQIPISLTESYSEINLIKLNDSAVSLIVRSSFVYNRMFVYKVDIDAGVPSVNARKLLANDVDILNSVVKVDEETISVNYIRFGFGVTNQIYKEFNNAFYKAQQFGGVEAQQQEYVSNGRIFQLSIGGVLESRSFIFSDFEVVRENVGIAKASSNVESLVSLYGTGIIGGYNDLFAGQRIVDEEDYKWGYALNATDIVKLPIIKDSRLKGWF